MAILDSFRETIINEKKNYIWRIRLATNDESPGTDFNPATLNEVTDVGYAAQVQTLGTGQDIEFGATTTVAGETTATANSAKIFDFTRTLSVNMMYVTVDRGSGEEVYQVERLANAPWSDGDGDLSITFTLRDSSS